MWTAWSADVAEAQLAEMRAELARLQRERARAEADAAAAAADESAARDRRNNVEETSDGVLVF